jgi:anti-sigma B factor antagonist
MSATPSAPRPELTLKVDSKPGGTVVNCAGRITAETTPLLLNEVRALIPNTKRVVLDLSQVNYLDSSGLGTVVRLWTTARKAGCEFKVANLSPRLKDLFTLTNISTIFENVEHAGM